jgi:hypothetical protein
MATRSFCFQKHFHGSKSEANDCNWLYARQQAGEIRGLKCWPSYDLHIGKKLWKKWKPDFEFEEFVPAGSAAAYGTGYWQKCIFESKGWNRSDDNFRIKLQAFLLEYPDIVVYVNRRRVKFTPKGRIVLRKKRQTWKSVIAKRAGGARALRTGQVVKLRRRGSSR